MRRTGDDIGMPGRDASREEQRRLRLVGGVVRTPQEAPRAGDASARPARVRADRQAHRGWEVSAENQAASGLSDFDARWVLAVRAAGQIEGGRAAVIRPEVRQRLVTTAKTMGLRPFDANLVLAIVQDAAREGRTTQDLETVESLMMVGAAEKRAARRPGLWVVVLVGCSAVWAGALVWWLLG